MSCASSSTADAELAALFARRGRRALFEELQRRGFSVEEGSAIAAAIVTAIQEGQIIVDDAMDSQFEEAAQAMPPVVRQLLVENTNPEAVLPEVLLDALGLRQPRAYTSRCKWIRHASTRHSLPSRLCAASSRGRLGPTA